MAFNVAAWLLLCSQASLQVESLRHQGKTTLRPQHQHRKHDTKHGHVDGHSKHHNHRHAAPVTLVADEQVEPSSTDYPDRRADLCGTVKEYQMQAGAGQKGRLLTAMAGEEISAAIFDYPDADEDMYKYDDVEGKWTGWMIDIMDAVSKRGGFKYSVYLVPMNESTTWTHDINLALTKHDVLLTWGLSTFERTNMGIHMPFGLLDASSELVTKKKVKKESMQDQIFQFLRPFQTSVWLAFLAICAATGVVYYFLERGQNDDDLPDGEALGNATFLAYFQVTGGGGYAPKSWPGKVMVISWAWMILLFTAAYTANLASFLVVKNSGSTSVSNMREAMAQNMDICVMGRSAVWEKVTSDYPDYGHFVPVDSSALGGLAAGKCEAALSLAFNTDFGRGDKNLNSNCDLKAVGGTLDQMSAGWAVKDDFVDRCTVLVTQVLEAILQDLQQDGTLPAFYRQLLEKKKTRKSCPILTTDSDDGRLGLMSMTGIFGVHVACCTVALALWAMWSGKPSLDA